VEQWTSRWHRPRIVDWVDLSMEERVEDEVTEQVLEKDYMTEYH